MIRKSLFTLTLTAALAIIAGPVDVSAQAMESAEPFKVGTFAINDTPTVGLVMRDDQLIVDLAAANRALELMPQYSRTIQGRLELISLARTGRGFAQQRVGGGRGPAQSVSLHAHDVIPEVGNSPVAAWRPVGFRRSATVLVDQAGAAQSSDRGVERARAENDVAAGALADVGNRRVAM